MGELSHKALVNFNSLHIQRNNRNLIELYRANICPLVKYLQEQLKKLTNKTSGKHEEKENQQNGNTNQNLMDNTSPLIVNGEKSQRASDERKMSPEMRGGEGGKKQAEAVKKMSELAARNPLYTSLHRWESTLHFAS